jgi:hypothetical protein
MCGPKFCSMKITQDVRDYAARLNEKNEGMAATRRDTSPNSKRSAARLLDRGAGRRRSFRRACAARARRPLTPPAPIASP